MIRFLVALRVLDSRFRGNDEGVLPPPRPLPHQGGGVLRLALLGIVGAIEALDSSAALGMTVGGGNDGVLSHFDILPTFFVVVPQSARPQSFYRFP